MINNNYDTLISEKEIWPLRPFLSETLDEGQTLRVGVLPGTVIFPDFEESYSPLDSDDIKYFNLKEEEGIYLYLEASYSMNPKYGKMNIRDPEIAIACVLKPSQKLAIKAVDKEIEALINAKKGLEIRIKELQDELSGIIGEIDKDIQNQESFTRELINEITDNPNLTEEQKAIQIGIAEDSLESYIERAEERKLYLEESYSNTIEGYRCFISEATTTTAPTTTEGPTTQSPTTLAPTLPENLPLDFQERYLTCSAYYEKDVKYPKYPPPITGFGGICKIDKEIARLEIVKGIIDARYSIAEEEERKGSIRYYVHNSVKISNVRLSIVKIKNPENEEKDGSIKVYFPLGLAIYITDKLDLSSELNLGIRPQLILSYGVSNKPTNTYKSMEILKCVYEDFLNEYTTINFSLGYV
jgi:hypothetical protein